MRAGDLGRGRFSLWGEGSDGFVWRGGRGCYVLGLGVENGFVWCFCKFGAEGSEAVEVFDGAAVEALGLGLVAEEEFPGLGIGGEIEKAFGEDEVLPLAAGDFQLRVAEVGVEEAGGCGFGGVMEARGEEAAFEAGGAEEVQLGDGDALDGAEFLAVDRLVDFDEVGAEFDKIVEALKDGDGDVVGGEAVFAGVLGRSSFAFGGAGARGTAGIGAIGFELLGRDGFGHRALSRFEI